MKVVSERMLTWAYLLGCGGVFVLVFYAVGYANIPGDYYVARDDGVITMSHGRNLVEHGFIGVGPSGERVEGYSAPVQMFAYALVYLIFGGGGVHLIRQHADSGLHFLAGDNRWCILSR